jgi:hypothetical protein
MATIFRAPLITAIAALSTTAATSAQSQPNFNVRLPLAAALPFIGPDIDPPPRLPALSVWHHRPQPPSKVLPFSQTLWPTPAVPLRQMVIDPVYNRIMLPLPPPGVPFINQDFPRPAAPILKPDTHLFYYMQDQTSPAFIQYDWPKAPKLPSLVADQVPSRLGLPVTAIVPPFRQRDWLNPATIQLAKVNDPQGRNAFLPPPVGLPTHQTDWPNPQAAKSQQGSHTLNDLGLLTLPIARPMRPLDWPNPKPVPQSAQARNVREPSVSILLVQRFKPEWAADSNQLLGPTRTQPETH